MTALPHDSATRSSGSRKESTPGKSSSIIVMVQDHLLPILAGCEGGRGEGWKGEGQREVIDHCDGTRSFATKFGKLRKKGRGRKVREGGGEEGEGRGRGAEGERVIIDDRDFLLASQRGLFDRRREGGTDGGGEFFLKPMRMTPRTQIASRATPGKHAFKHFPSTFQQFSKYHQSTCRPPCRY